MTDIIHLTGKPNRQDATSVQPFSVADFDGKIVPEREWCVRNFIPHRTVTLISGDGGVGKTQLALQLCAAKATNTNWLGLETRTWGGELMAPCWRKCRVGLRAMTLQGGAVSRACACEVRRRHPLPRRTMCALVVSTRTRRR